MASAGASISAVINETSTVRRTDFITYSLRNGKRAKVLAPAKVQEYGGGAVKRFHAEAGLDRPAYFSDIPKKATIFRVL